jgi:hypothetical protein
MTCPPLNGTAPRERIWGCDAAPMNETSLYHQGSPAKGSPLSAC